MQRRNSKTKVSLGKCIKWFPLTIRRRNTIITGHFGFVVEENSVREVKRYIVPGHGYIVFENLRFPSGGKRKPGVVKFLWFEERFWKAPFSWRIGVDSRPNRRNKAVFSNFSVLVWTLQKKSADNLKPHFGKFMDLKIIKQIHPRDLGARKLSYERGNER